MRKTPVEYIREGQILAKPLIDKSGNTVLEADSILDYNTIRKIKSEGQASVFVKDRHTPEEVETLIKPRIFLKFQETNNKISKIMAEDFKNNHPSKRIDQKMNAFARLNNEVLENITNSKEIINNMIYVSTYDDYTFDHSVNVMMLSIVMGKAAGLSIDELKALALGCLLHDIGKIFIPLSIMNKKSKLSDKEFNVIRNHPLKGFEFLRDCTDLSPLEKIPSLTHHERWDGTGYPYGKDKENIHLFGRICAICDVFEALTADRPYRKGIKPNEAIEYIMANGNSYFDYELVKLFVSNINVYPKDTMVFLSDNTEGIVVDINEKFLRPVVKIYCEGGKAVEPRYIDLMTVRNLVIKDIIYKFSDDEIYKKVT